MNSIASFNALFKIKRNNSERRLTRWFALIQYLDTFLRCSEVILPNPVLSRYDSFWHWVSFISKNLYKIRVLLMATEQWYSSFLGSFLFSYCYYTYNIDHPAEQDRRLARVFSENNMYVLMWFFRQLKRCTSGSLVPKAKWYFFLEIHMQYVFHRDKWKLFIPVWFTKKIFWCQRLNCYRNI